jgi:oligopeptide/dipeptide ABC transporter ATP-binding protein
LSTLVIRDLQVVYVRRGKSPVAAVDGVDLDVQGGEIVGLVGETGCGKSTVARAAVGLVKPTRGEVLLDGRPIDLLSRATRTGGNLRLQMVFQNPYGSLNPRRTVGDQIADGLRSIGVRRQAQQRLVVSELLAKVGLPGTVSSRYPHEFSGGQRQRIAVARALAVEPQIIVLDEPLSALDASAQAQIANLLLSLTQELGVGMMLISHDLAILRHVANRIVVMYLGRVVETAPTAELWGAPQHPYTQALIAAIPSIAERKAPIPVKGEIPDPATPPTGCRFHPRCPYAFGPCQSRVPPLIAIDGDRTVACWLHDEAAAGLSVATG